MVHVEQRQLQPNGNWQLIRGSAAGRRVQFVLVFGGRMQLKTGTWLASLQALYPGARVISASTSGEILGTEISEDRITCSAVAMEKTSVSFAETTIGDAAESRACGQKLATMMIGENLSHVLVFSDGQHVNGSDLARGFTETLPAGVQLSGGLAGDGTRFEETVVGLDSAPGSGRIVVIGFYGKDIQINCGTGGGWAPFGPQRFVTNAAGNVLYTLDDRSALELYKTYLGEQAMELPASALRFPLCVQPPGEIHSVVRTILSIDEAKGSMTFAGDVPMGSRVSFMRGFQDDLVDGAGIAAEMARKDQPLPQFAICVSCVGRRLVLGQRTEDETERVAQVLGTDAMLAGFYSYGELAPVTGSAACRLHNQTMTITTFYES